LEKFGEEIGMTKKVVRPEEMGFTIIKSEATYLFETNGLRALLMTTREVMRMCWLMGE